MGFSQLSDAIEFGLAQEPALHLDRSHACHLWRMRRDESSEKCPNSSAELYSASIRENARTLRKFQERGVYAASAFLFGEVLWKKTHRSGLKPRAPLGCGFAALCP